MSDALFHVDAPPVERDDMAGLSPNRRRTARQLDALRNGYHPLALALPVDVNRHLPLHPEAAPVDDQKAPGRRCGNCRWRRVRAFPKCVYPENRSAEDYEHDGPPRVTRGAGTDVRAWWPGCRDHEPGDPDLPDAMRWVPDTAEIR